jgi:colanic acid biosynthesis glycosyl transferase WcaI
MLARLKRSRLVFHVQDLQPDAALETGLLKPGLFARALLALERHTYALADRVSTISRAMRSRIQAKGVGQGKTMLLANWANDDLVRPRDPDTDYRRAWRLDGRFVVLYSGNLGVKQGLDVLLDCARLSLSDPDLVFVIVGDGGERGGLVARARRERLDNVQFHPLQPEERLSDLLATANVAVIPQRPGVTDIVLPSKLANILAAERAVIATAHQASELARTLQRAQCGIVVPPGDAVALAKAIARLKGSPLELARMGANGRCYMRERLSRDAVLPRAREALLSL